MDHLVDYAEEFFQLMLGEKVGVGQSREVYIHRHNPDWVVKVEVSGKDFQNAHEWRLWHDLKETDLKKWFAPCVDISDNGMFLIQERVSIPDVKSYPKKIPLFLSHDTQYQNFGFISKQFVCCDYGFFTSRIRGSSKLVRADWWNGLRET